MEYLINRTDSGWVVTLFNNNGVYKPQQGLAQVDRGASVMAIVSLAGRAAESAREWTGDTTLAVKSKAVNQP
mgnify:CR=1 FL=1